MPRERTNDDYEDEWADRQARNAGNCKCAGDMPGYCPGPASCPMCQPGEEAAADADEALNRTKVERADARALRDQIMLGVLLGASI